MYLSAVPIVNLYGKEVIMPLGTLIFALVFVGLLLYAVNRWVPMEPRIKSILMVVVVAGVILWILGQLGIIPIQVPIVQIVIALVAAGFVMWIVNALIPMEANIKQILNIVVIVFIVVWLLYAFGILPALNTIRIP